MASMAHSPKFDAVIFDMDGLMFDTERIGFDAFLQAARMHGYEPTEKFFMNMIGKTVPDADRLMREEFGEDFPIDKVRDDRRRIISDIRNTSGIPMKTGLRELLQHLREKNIPLAVASSSAREIVEENLNHGNIAEHFRVLVCGDEVTNGKPNPEIFLKAAGKLSKNPSVCIVLEDSLPGVTAAHAAGMIPIMIPDMQEPTEAISEITHKIFPSLHDVRNYLGGDA